MKKNQAKIPLVFAFILSMISSPGQEPNKMTVDLWKEDIEFLGRKIEKEFATFHPDVKQQFASELNDLKNSLPQLQEYEVKIRLMKAIAQLADGHTEINVGQKAAGFHRLPIVINFMEDKLYVVNAHESLKEILGAEVEAFGGISTHQIFEELKKNISHDNEMEFLYAGPGYLILTEVLHYLGSKDALESSTLTLKFKTGNSKTVNLFGLNQEEYVKGPWLSYLKANQITAPLYIQNSQKNYWYQYLKGEQALYFHFREMLNQDGEPSISKFISSMFKEIDKEKPQRLIIDLRNNTGGNYKLSQDLIDAIKTRAWLNQAGKIWIITGRATFSAATVTSAYLKQETAATIIGEPGRGNPNASDNVEHLNLPHSKLVLEYANKVKKHWPELGESDRVPVDMSITTGADAYFKGTDPILEYILKLK